jgi:hypothetical protein
VSSGHHAHSALDAAELDHLLDEALANANVKARLAKPFELVTQFDICLLGSSSIGGRKVYLDRHLRFGNRPYGVIMVGDRPLDVKPGLIRHERLEQALEDCLGWPYLPLAHPVAQRWEERDYKAKGFDPRDVERAFRQYIKFDAHERITKSPTDLDMRPLLSPPVSQSMIARINQTDQREKRSQQSVAYVAKSVRPSQRCDICRHYVDPKYAGSPACTGVDSPISPDGWCRRFSKGSLLEG